MNLVVNELNVIARNPNLSVGIRKMALVTRMISGMNVVHAVNVLTLCKKSCAKDILLLLQSAIKNAVNNFNIDDITNLYVKEIRLGRGRHLKRFMARARGRSNRIIKHSSNLVIILGAR